MVTFSFTEGERGTAERGTARPHPALGSQRSPLLSCGLPAIPPRNGISTTPQHPPQDYRATALKTSKTHQTSKFCEQSSPALSPSVQQPARNQQLPTPTGQTQVKTHGTLLFRQTQITASSADCTRDERTHVNDRLNFAIHLSKARNISKTASISPTNPLQPTEQRARPRCAAKKQTTFASHFPCRYFTPPKKHTLQAKMGWRDKITWESSRGSQNLALRLPRQTPVTSGQPQKRIRSLRRSTLFLCRRAKSQFFKATSFCCGLV